MDARHSLLYAEQTVKDHGESQLDTMGEIISEFTVPYTESKGILVLLDDLFFY